MLSIVTLVILTYLAFVFFSESMNPFAKPKLQLNRSQWRYGRLMALAVFIGGVCTIFLLEIGSAELHSAVAVGGAIATSLYISHPVSGLARA
ncbi:hypothetical protein IMCC3135_22750 [Granulosicoccus antarcticus IMCC3135]|uniref:Uncharacterized protein n=1 Tax=Granulosicoccus antarcticus IMCC3135 TaxID=1192854 RepID=A0A2Z2P0F3_9GAMM|nr:hypothetical protein IMCC3135_22750 [Granulosicoccus antarcticus IMCC3135]